MTRYQAYYVDQEQYVEPHTASHWTIYSHAIWFIGVALILAGVLLLGTGGCNS